MKSSVTFENLKSRAPPHPKESAGMVWASSHLLLEETRVDTKRSKKSIYLWFGNVLGSPKMSLEKDI